MTAAVCPGSPRSRCCANPGRVVTASALPSCCEQHWAEAVSAIAGLFLDDSARQAGMLLRLGVSQAVRDASHEQLRALVLGAIDEALADGRRLAELTETAA